MNYQNNYVERSSIKSNAAKNIDLLVSLIVHNNHFGPNKIIFRERERERERSVLDLTKFLDLLTKLFRVIIYVITLKI